MKYRNGTRLLIATILATAVLSAAVEARAARTLSTSFVTGARTTSSTTKPTAGPMIGEPDVTGTPAPLPPKIGPYPTGGNSGSTGFMSRIRAIVIAMWKSFGTTLRLP